MRFTVKALALVPLLAACASAGNTGASGESVRANERVRVNELESLNLTHDVEVNQMDFAAGRARVWNAALESLKALAFPLTESNEATGHLTHWNADVKHSINGKRTSTYFDCGTGPTGQRADTYRLSVKVVQSIDSLAANTTRVRTEVQAVARSGGMSSDALHCNSTGKLETLVTSMITTRLQ